LVRRDRDIRPEAGALGGLGARAGERGQQLEQQQLQQLKEEELRARVREERAWGLDRMKHASLRVTSITTFDGSSVPRGT
jgi:hypothetical protein